MRKGVAGLLGATLSLTASVSPVAAQEGFLTDEPPYITLASGVEGTVLPIITVGETLGDFLFEGIPDGIGLMPGEGETVRAFVNHEQSTVPFMGEADFEDSSVSELVLSTGSNPGAVLGASVPLPPEAGFIRFCSSFMAGPAEGFRSYTLFTNEESNDIVDLPPGAVYGPDPALAPNRQAGYTVWFDPVSGEFEEIAGLGRMNHENTLVVPGDWNRLALLTTDDTFTAPSSQLYLYLARNEHALRRDRGGLWAFQVTRTDGGPVRPRDPFNEANDYLDIQPGDVWQGRFIRVPRDIARGDTNAAPQTALEEWSNANNVFQFIRLEDLAYDDHNSRVVYVADTGATRIVPDPTTGRLLRGPTGTVGFADNGRIFRFELDVKNPRRVVSFSVFADGDAPDSPEFVAMRSPDNLDTSPNSLMLQEDAANAKIWRYDFAAGTWTVLATVNDPEGESSGIVDASAWFGDGAWLLDVQAHGSDVASEQVGDVRIKREAGQLLLMTIAGS